MVSRLLKAMLPTLRRDIYELQDPGRSVDEVKPVDPDPLNPFDTLAFTGLTTFARWRAATTNWASVTMA
jgi:hypothetical protein